MEHTISAFAHGAATLVNPRLILDPQECLKLQRYIKNDEGLKNVAYRERLTQA